VEQRFNPVISGGNGIASVVQSNSEPSCADALCDDGAVDTTFVNDTLADIVFATVVTTA
jgi:hypothetical protein